jgi:hypothetical protein
MALIVPDSTGMPVHEPVHGGADITAIPATQRYHDGRRMARLAVPSWSPPASHFPPPGGPRHSPCYDSDKLDALTVGTLPTRSPRPAGEPPRTSQSWPPDPPAQSGWRLPSRPHMAEQMISAVTVQTAEQSA